MNRFSKIAASVAAAILLSGAAHAELYTSPSDSTIIVDDTQGLEWLRLDQTFNFNYSDITFEMEAGGMFEQFRFAGRGEVDNLFFDYFGADMMVDESTTFVDGEMADLYADMFGREFTDMFSFHTTGIVNDGYTGSGLMMGGGSGGELLSYRIISDGMDATASNPYFAEFSEEREYESDPGFGWYLVKDDTFAGPGEEEPAPPPEEELPPEQPPEEPTDVSAPLSIASLALMGMMGLRRRRG